MHRIGGLEKEDGTGNINYTPENHERMVHLRAAKVAGIANDIPPVEVDGDARRRAARARLGLDVGARSTPPCSRVRARRHEGGAGPPHPPQPVPAEPRRGAAAATRKVLVPEMNLGPAVPLVRAEFLVDAQSVSKVQGRPFTAGELETRHPRRHCR